jgi:hypothetical protein
MFKFRPIFIRLQKTSIPLFTRGSTNGKWTVNFFVRAGGFFSMFDIVRDFKPINR